MAHMDGGTATLSLISGADFSLKSVEMRASGGSGTARSSAYNNGTLFSSTDISVTQECLRSRPLKIEA